MWKKLAWLYHFTNNGGLSAYKHNILVTCFCVPNRQAFSWYILSDLKVSTLGLCLKAGLYRMSVYSGFCLDRFNCSFKLRVLNIFCICCNIAWYLLKYNYLTEFLLSWHYRRGVFDTKLCDEVCQWLATGWWFSTGTPVSSTNTTDRHDITEILVKVALSTIKPNQTNFRFGLLEDCTALVFSLFRSIHHMSSKSPLACVHCLRLNNY